jgi:hypothetical protein
MIVLFLYSYALLAVAGDEPKRPVATQPELRAELLRRTKIDQEARLALIAWQKEMGVAADNLSADQKAESERLTTELRKIDEANTKWLKEYVETHGWPSITVAGEDGAHLAWLLVQHADRDPKFQRTCLDLMTRLPREEVTPADIAYLTDRVLLKEGKKQLYGTQFEAVDGNWQPRPLEDAANVDRRRAEAGLSPLVEYARQMEEVYGRAQTK